MNFTPAAEFLFAWVLCALIGYGPARVFLPRSWHRDRLLIAPACGGGLIILIAAASSYVGFSMRAAALLDVGLGLAASGGGVLLTRRDRPGPSGWRMAVGIHTLAFVVAGSYSRRCFE